MHMHMHRIACAWYIDIACVVDIAFAWCVEVA